MNKKKIRDEIIAMVFEIIGNANGVFSNNSTKDDVLAVRFNGEANRRVWDIDRLLVKLSEEEEYE